MHKLLQIICILISTASVPVFAAQSAAPPDSLFQQGNAAYREGDYPAAEASYRRILGLGIENGPVYFNLGNACFKQKKLGQAIYFWEKARQITPADPEILENLDLANLLIVDKIETPEDPFPVRALKNIRDLLTVPQESLAVLVLFLAANLLFFFYVVLKNPRHSFRALIGFLVAGFLTLLLAGSLAWKVYDRDFRTKGIVLAQKADVLSGPGAENVTVFTIHEGIKVRVHGSSNGWVQISLPNGWNGWLPQDSVGIL
jgi:tetratricopeptide (TPR) repeat protein